MQSASITPLSLGTLPADRQNLEPAVRDAAAGEPITQRHVADGASPSPETPTTIGIPEMPPWIHCMPARATNSEMIECLARLRLPKDDNLPDQRRLPWEEI